MRMSMLASAALALVVAALDSALAEETLVTRDVGVFVKAAVAEETPLTLDIEASLTRQSPAETRSTRLTTTVRTPLGERVKIVHELQGRKLSIAVTPSNLDNGHLRLAFVLSEITDAGEKVLAEPALHTVMNQTASFVHGAVLDGYSFRLAVTPRP